MRLVKPEYLVLMEFLEVVNTDDFDDSTVGLLKQISIYSDLDLLLNCIDVLFIYQAFQSAEPALLNYCCCFTILRTWLAQLRF